MTITNLVPRLLLASLLLGSSLPLLANELRIGYAPNTFYAPILIAKQKKWLEEELATAGALDTKVTWHSFSAGPLMNEALTANQLDIAFTGDFPAILGKSTGLETHLIGIASSGYSSQAGVVLANSSLKSIKDLKGKKVATFKGTTAHHLLVLALQEAGLQLTDIELVNLSLGDINNALLNGDVDAAFLWEPLLSKLELDHSIRILRDGQGLKNAIAVIEATDHFVAQHRKEAKALLKAVQRGNELIQAKPEEAAQLVARELAQPEPIIHHSLQKFSYDIKFTPSITTALVDAEAFLSKQQLIRSPVSIKTFIDPTLVDELSRKE